MCLNTFQPDEELLRAIQVYQVPKKPNHKEMDIVLIYPTTSGEEIKYLKPLFAGEVPQSLQNTLSENFAMVIAGGLPESYISDIAFMERVKFLGRPFCPAVDNSSEAIWNCPHPGIACGLIPQVHGVNQ